MSTLIKSRFQTPVGAPSGLTYLPNFLSEGEEDSLLKKLKRLKWDTEGIVKYRGQIARRRQIDFLYNFNVYSRKLSLGRLLPTFLQPLRDRCERVLCLAPGDIQSVIALLYPPGGRIGWHTDSDSFGDTICGLSLGSTSVMRFREKGQKKIWCLDLDPRSLVVMRGAARTDYQHEIPTVTEERYCITMRDLPRDRGTD
jgi:alkylated DNA repair protein (DNA oxidative demethylase)